MHKFPSGKQKVNCAEKYLYYTPCRRSPKRALSLEEIDPSEDKIPTRVVDKRRWCTAICITLTVM